MTGDAGAGGSIVEAPRSGNRVRYLETAEATDGEHARFEMWLPPPPHSHDPVRHVRPEQDEYVEVREGHLGVWHDGTTRRLGPGESAAIPLQRRSVRMLAPLGLPRGYTTDYPEYVPGDRRDHLGR